MRDTKQLIWYLPLLGLFIGNLLVATVEYDVKSPDLWEQWRSSHQDRRFAKRPDGWEEGEGNVPSFLLPPGNHSTRITNDFRAPRHLREEVKRRVMVSNGIIFDAFRSVKVKVSDLLSFVDINVIKPIHITNRMYEAADQLSKQCDLFDFIWKRRPKISSHQDRFVVVDPKPRYTRKEADQYCRALGHMPLIILKSHVPELNKTLQYYAIKSVWSSFRSLEGNKPLNPNFNLNKPIDNAPVPLINCKGEDIKKQKGFWDKIKSYRFELQYQIKAGQIKLAMIPQDPQQAVPKVMCKPEDLAKHWQTVEKMASLVCMRNPNIVEDHITTKEGYDTLRRQHTELNKECFQRVHKIREKADQKVSRFVNRFLSRRIELLHVPNKGQMTDPDTLAFASWTSKQKMGLHPRVKKAAFLALSLFTYLLYDTIDTQMTKASTTAGIEANRASFEKQAVKLRELQQGQTKVVKDIHILFRGLTKLQSSLTDVLSLQLYGQQISDFRHRMGQVVDKVLELEIEVESALAQVDALLQTAITGKAPSNIITASMMEQLQNAVKDKGDYELHASFQHAQFSVAPVEGTMNVRVYMTFPIVESTTYHPYKVVPVPLFYQEHGHVAIWPIVKHQHVLVRNGRFFTLSESKFLECVREGMCESNGISYQIDSSQCGIGNLLGSQAKCDYTPKEAHSGIFVYNVPPNKYFVTTAEKREVTISCARDKRVVKGQISEISEITIPEQCAAKIHHGDSFVQVSGVPNSPVILVNSEQAYWNFSVDTKSLPQIDLEETLNRQLVSLSELQGLDAKVGRQDVRLAIQEKTLSQQEEAVNRISSEMATSNDLHEWKASHEGRIQHVTEELEAIKTDAVKVDQFSELKEDVGKVDNRILEVREIISRVEREAIRPDSFNTHIVNMVNGIQWLNDTLQQTDDQIVHQSESISKLKEEADKNKQLQNEVQEMKDQISSELSAVKRDMAHKLEVSQVNVDMKEVKNDLDHVKGSLEQVTQKSKLWPDLHKVNNEVKGELSKMNHHVSEVEEAIAKQKLALEKYSVTLVDTVKKRQWKDLEAKVSNLPKTVETRVKRSTDPLKSRLEEVQAKAMAWRMKAEAKWARELEKVKSSILVIEDEVRTWMSSDSEDQNQRRATRKRLGDQINEQKTRLENFQEYVETNINDLKEITIPVPALQAKQSALEKAILDLEQEFSARTLEIQKDVARKIEAVMKHEDERGVEWDEIKGHEAQELKIDHVKDMTDNLVLEAASSQNEARAALIFSAVFASFIIVPVLVKYCRRRFWDCTVAEPIISSRETARNFANTANLAVTDETTLQHIEERLRKSMNTSSPSFSQRLQSLEKQMEKLVSQHREQSNERDHPLPGGDLGHM